MKKDFNVSVLNDIYGMLLTDNQHNMIDSYYNCDLSLSEIAENCGISRQAVRDSIVKGKEALMFYEEKLGFKKKLDLISKALEQCLTENDIDILKERLFEISINI